MWVTDTGKFFWSWENSYNVYDILDVDNKMAWIGLDIPRITTNKIFNEPVTSFTIHMKIIHYHSHND